MKNRADNLLNSLIILYSYGIVLDQVLIEITLLQN